MADDVHPVDQFLPVPKLLTLGLQHVLVMYAGAVAVPLILGRALKLPPEDVAFLISADLFTCGLATLVQCIGFPGVGIRLPVMMGVTFASVGPMLSMAAAPDVGLLGIYGSVIAAGVFAVLVAPFMGRLLPLFPPVVTGTIILVIGVSLMRVGINWAGGGLPTLTKIVDGAKGAFPNPSFGQLEGLGVALFVLLVILALLRFFKGFVSNVAVLLGIVAGAVLASLLGVIHFDKVVSAPWVDVVAPLRFGPPKFQLVPIVTMCIVMIVVMIESTGMFLALGEMTGRRIDQAAITRGRRRHDPRRHFQHVPLHVFFAECRSRWRYRRALALGHGDRRSHYGGARLASEDVRPGRSRASGRAGRGRHRHVRHGRGHGRAHSHRSRLQDQSLQPVCRGDRGRFWHDPPGRSQLLSVHARSATAAVGIGHLAGGDRFGATQSLLQRPC